MFDNLISSFSRISRNLSGRGIVSDSDIEQALREVRIALLEADVALEVVKSFIDSIRENLKTVTKIKNVATNNLLMKVVNDELVKILGAAKAEINLKASTPVVILMVGLQGVGKTTSAAKLAARLTKYHHKKVLLASLDKYRPAAAEQLASLAKTGGLDYFDGFDPAKSVADLAKSALEKAKTGFDVVILDSAGRLHLDADMMAEIKQVRDITTPTEILLTLDAMMGQDALAQAREFNEQIGITGIILTRMDGDSRGGAAISAYQITNSPIKFIGVGEKIGDLEDFDPERVAGRILGMGDVVALAQKAQDAIGEEESKKLSKKLQKGEFDLEDLLAQLKNMAKMGGLMNTLSLIPGFAAAKEKLNDKMINEAELKSVEAIINSMTRRERKKPDILQMSHSRKNRIAKGSGTSIIEVNRLLKRFREAQKMLQALRSGKIDKQKLLGGIF